MVDIEDGIYPRPCRQTMTRSLGFILNMMENDLDYSEQLTDVIAFRCYGINIFTERQTPVENISDKSHY